MKRIYTIGYGGRSLRKFLEILKDNGISMVVDVRRFPTSKNPDFKRENLEASLREAGVGYMYLGDLLGGFRRGGYERYMESEEYRVGIEQLLKVMEEGMAVIMCKEKNVGGCHRRFISKTLVDLGVEVIHL